MGGSLKIGILGTRGIPNRYGGFEQCAEYLALGLLSKGHEVWVYNAHNHEFKGGNWNGVHIIHCNDPEHKMGTVGQFIYDLNCINDSRKRNFDVLLQLGYTSNSIWYFLWPKNCSNIVNMDGLEWKRTKYNKYVRRFLKHAEKLAALNADVLIADSTGIQQHLKNTYNKPSVFIPYGAKVFDHPEAGILNRYNLEPFSYHLLIARMEPENNIEVIIKGVLESKTEMPLIIVGKTDNGHGTFLKETYGHHKNIRFLGGIYDIEVVNNIRYFSLLYFHGHSVGGTNPSLLEAMGCNTLIAAHDNIFNKSILGDDAFYFSTVSGLANTINSVNDKDQFCDKLENNICKIRKQYSWDNVVNQYEQVLLEAAKCK